MKAFVRKTSASTKFFRACRQMSLSVLTARRNQKTQLPQFSTLSKSRRRNSRKTRNGTNAEKARFSAKARSAFPLNLRSKSVRCKQVTAESCTRSQILKVLVLFPLLTGALIRWAQSRQQVAIRFPCNCRHAFSVPENGKTRAEANS